MRINHFNNFDQNQKPTYYNNITNNKNSKKNLNFISKSSKKNWNKKTKNKFWWKI